MALNKGENAGTIYLSVANGKLVRKHQAATKETVTRISTKNGKTYHEEFFKDLTGVISKIETKENDFGKQWQIVFTDGEDRYMVQLPYSSRYSSSFLKALPNVKHNTPVRFMPWEMQDKNNPAKMVNGITLYQNDGNGEVKIPPAFTKEEPKGMPEMRKVKVKGKETWDDSDLTEFLEAQAMTWISKNAGTEAAGELEEAPF